MAMFEALQETLGRQSKGGMGFKHEDLYNMKKIGVNAALKVSHSKVTSSPGGISHTSDDSGYQQEQDDHRMELVVAEVLGRDVYEEEFLESSGFMRPWPPRPISDPPKKSNITCRYLRHSKGQFENSFWIVPEGSYSRWDGVYNREAAGEVLSHTQKTIDIMDAAIKETLVELDKLSHRTGMPITQENGQRRYGPPIGETFVPTKGTEVFVGKLPRDCIETEIVPIFEQVGRIYEIRLMMDFSGTNRGYCFVQYFTPVEASRAVKDLNQFEIRKGRFIGVTKSVDNCRLFVGGIPKEKSKSDIFDEINKVTDGVVRVIAYPSIKDRSENRGFAFVEYESHKAAAMARRKMIPGKIQMWGTDIAVDWAEPEPDVDIEIMKKVKALYVRNLRMTTTEDTIRDVFNQASDNAVERVKKLKDYGFVHFLDREAAEIAMERLNESEIDGSTVQIMWAKPVDKRAYQAQKALGRTLYSPARVNNNLGNQYMNINQPVNFNSNFFNSNNMYAGNARMIQNQYQGFAGMSAENLGLQHGGGMFPAQQFGGDSSRALEHPGFQAYQQFGDNVGLQNQLPLMPSPQQQPTSNYNFHPSIIEQFQRMGFSNESRPFRGRAAGGVQGMRFPSNFNRQLPAQGFNPYFQFPQNPMSLNAGY